MAVRQAVALRWQSDTMVVLVGEYDAGPRLCSAVVSGTPKEDEICRTREDRKQAERVGKEFVWCTLEALRGSPAFDPVAKSILALRMFVRPVEELLESSGWNIRTGRKSAVDVITAPEEDQRLLPAWKALSDSKTADDKLLQLLAACRRSQRPTARWLVGCGATSPHRLFSE